MTVLSIHDNEEFRILAQVDHSKPVKHMPFKDFFDNFKFMLYLSFQFFKYFTPTKTIETQLGCEDLEYLTFKVEQNRKLAIWVWFMLDHVQALVKILKNSETGYLLVFRTWNGLNESLFKSKSKNHTRMFADTRREAFLPRKWTTRTDQVTCYMCFSPTHFELSWSNKLIVLWIGVLLTRLDCIEITRSSN